MGILRKSTPNLTGKTSQRARDGTRKQIDGIIKVLESNLKAYKAELKKCTDSKIVKGITRNVQVTDESLKYYVLLREEYAKNGLI